MAKAPARKRIRIEYVPVESLQPADYNPRLMAESDMAKLQRSLAEWGVVDPVIVRRENGEVVGGHQRLEAAKREGLAEVPVVYLDGLSDQQAKLLNVALNKISGEWDMPKLGALLLELGDVPDLDLSMAGFDPAEATVAVRAYQRGQPGLTDDDAVPEAPEPITKRGDLWLLGEHRLLCGDATKAGDVERLLDGAKPNLCVTDPPYGVDYDPQWRQDAYEKGLIRFGAKRTGVVANDDRVNWEAAWALILSEVVYCWHAGRHASAVQVGIEAVGFEVRCQIIWRKATFVLGRGAYHWQHEPCWYAVRKGANAHWIGDRSQSTIWDIDGHIGYRSEGVEDQTPHATQKPLECMARPIRNHDAPEVYDPFLGSGTTLIACEKLGRRCYGMEIEPRYVDVAVKRWEEFTGKEAVRDGA